METRRISADDRWGGALLGAALAAIGPVTRCVVDGHGTGAAVALGITALAAATAAALTRRWQVRLLIALGAGIAAAGLAGRVTGVWLALGLITADWAITDRPPVPGAPRASRLSLPGVVIVVAVAALRSGAGHPARVVVISTAAAWGLIAFAATRGALLQRWLRAVGRVAGILIGVPLFAAVSVPLLLLPWVAQRLTGADPLDDLLGKQLGWRRVRERDTRPVTMWATSRERRPTTAGPRLRRSASSLLVGLVLILAAVGLWRWGSHRADDAASTATAPSGSDAATQQLPAALRGLDWYDQYEQDMAFIRQDTTAWRPLSASRLRDVSTRHVNVVDGHRVSWQPPPCDCRRLTIWLYGGSAAFGLGQRDGHTIASELARAAWRDGVAVEVSNRGVLGDTHWEAAQRFAWDLTAQRPDLVLFYDGYNEVQASLGLDDASVRDGPEFVARGFWDQYLEREHANPGTTPSWAVLPPAVPVEPGSAEAWGAFVATRYERSRVLSSAVAEDSAVPVWYAWQPTIEHRDPVPGEPTEPGSDWARARSDAMLATLGEEVHDLTHVFDGVEEPIFYDQVHTNELGARLVGERIYALIEPQLSALGG